MNAAPAICNKNNHIPFFQVASLSLECRPMLGGYCKDHAVSSGYKTEDIMSIKNRIDTLITNSLLCETEQNQSPKIGSFPYLSNYWDPSEIKGFTLVRFSQYFLG
jgi:hypothetical protein